MTVRRGSTAGLLLQVAQTAGTIVAGAYGGPWGAAAAQAGHTAFWAWQDSKAQKFDDIENRQDRLADLGLQTSTLGIPIPQIWGKIGGMAGNMIWAADKVPHEMREVIEAESSGKGGPSGPRQINITITYTQSYAIALCDTRLSGPIAGISRIHKNSNLYWDTTQNGGTLPDGWTFYPGTATQSPDPTMEAALGAGNVPRYPYLCYVVIADDDQGRSGQTPVYNFELFQTTAGTTGLSTLAVSPTTGDVWVTIPGLEQVARYDETTRQLVATVQLGPTDPQGFQTSAPIAIDSSGIVFAGDLYNNTVTRLDGSTNAILTIQSMGNAIPCSNIVLTAGDGWMCGQDPLTVTIVSGVPLPTLSLHRFTTTTPVAIALGIASGESQRLAVGADGHLWLAQQTLVVGVGIVQAKVLRVNPTTETVVADIAGVGGAYDVAVGADGHIWVAHPEGDVLYRINPATNAIIATVGVVDAPVRVAVASDGYVWVSSRTARTLTRINPADNSVQSFTANSRGDQSAFTHNFAQGQAGAMWVLDDTANTATLVQTDGTTLTVRTGMLPADIATGASTTVWVVSRTSGNLQQISTDGTTQGLVTGNDLPSLVTTFCTAVGLTDIDVTDMPDDVVSLILLNVEAARVPLEQLALAYRFYAVESGFALKFRQRGVGTLTFAITEEELGAGEEQADETGLRVRRLQEADLPTSIEIAYVDPDQNYQRNTQPGQLALPASGIENARSVNIGSIALHADSARQLAYELAVEAWVQREILQSTLTREYATLEPGDRGTITARGLTYTVVIAETAYGAPGLVEFTARVDAAYIRNAIIAVPGMVTPNPQTVSIVGDTEALLLNLPALNSSDIPARYHVAYIGETEPWEGGGLYRSTDGGTSYGLLDVAALEGITGTVALATANADWHFLDTTTSISVTLEYGSLSSISDLSLYNGGNLALIGDEIIGFGIATLTATRTYTLTRLLRGRRGTEHFTGTHGTNEHFVLIDAGLRAIGMELADRHVERDFKAVTASQDIADVTATQFTPTAANLNGWSVAQPDAELDGSDWIIEWRYRSRFSGAWVDGGGIGFDIDHLGFRIDIYQDGTFTTVVRSTITDGGSSMDAEALMQWTYTSAMQTTDHGSPQAIIYFKVYSLTNNGISVADAVTAS